MHGNLRRSAQVFIWGNLLIQKTTGPMGRRKETINVKVENVPTEIDHSKGTTGPSKRLYSLTILITALTLLPLGFTVTVSFITNSKMNIYLVLWLRKSLTFRNFSITY